MIEYNLPEKFYFRHKTSNRRYLAILDVGGNYDIMDANNEADYITSYAPESVYLNLRSGVWVKYTPQEDADTAPKQRIYMNVNAIRAAAEQEVERNIYAWAACEDELRDQRAAIARAEEAIALAIAKVEKAARQSWAPEYGTIGSVTIIFAPHNEEEGHMLVLINPACNTHTFNAPITDVLRSYNA